MEVHTAPSLAPCDGHRMYPIDSLFELIISLLKIEEAISEVVYNAPFSDD